MAPALATNLVATIQCGPKPLDQEWTTPVSTTLSQSTAPSAAMARNDGAPLDPHRWAMFVILLVGAFLPPLDFFIVNVSLPSIQGDLGTSSSAEQLVISAYATLYAVTAATGGRLGDLYGRGRMFFLGLIGFAAASTCAASPGRLGSWSLDAHCRALRQP